MAERKSKSCSVRKKVFRIILAVFLIFAVKITVTILSKPKVTTDYVAKLNQLTKPASYDPQENAAPYYQKAFDLFVETPETFDHTDIYTLISPYSIHWPGELDPNSVKMLEEWLAENQPAFEQIKLATEKPYYWIERKLQENEETTFQLKYPELYAMRNITEAMLWDAVIKAYSGNDEAAFEDILTCYKMGMHKSNASLLIMEQLLGQRIKKLSAETAMVILDRKRIKNAILGKFQSKLVSLIEKDNFIKGFAIKKLEREEFMDFTFSCDPLGPDRLAFENYSAFQCMCGDPWYQWIYCFVGPDKKEVADITDKTFLLYKQLSDKTPWELENRYKKEMERIEILTNGSFFTKLHAIAFTSIIKSSTTSKAIIDSMVTTVALLRYKIDHGGFPEKLDTLVSDGYLEELPADPFSDKPLGYRVVSDNFKLYSIGYDFEDNKAEAEIYEPTDPMKMMPAIQLPPRWGKTFSIRQNDGKILKYRDIVYWPVMRPEKMPERQPANRNPY